MNTRTKQFFLILSLSFTLSSCVLNHNSNPTQSYVSHTSSLSYLLDYESFSERIIKLERFFKQKENEYYVYVFSRTCSPCNEIKELVLQIAFDMPNLFFLEYTSDIKVSSNSMNLLIGTCDVEKIYINGTPSLFRVEKSRISYALSGKTKIAEYLIEESAM